MLNEVYEANKPLVENFKKILKEHLGQLILVIYFHEVMTSCSFSQGSSEKRSDFFLGRITDADEMVNNGFRLEKPYFHFLSATFSMECLELKEEDYQGLTSIESIMAMPRPGKDLSTQESQFVIGDRAVQEWFEKLDGGFQTDGQLLYYRSSKLFGRPLGNLSPELEKALKEKRDSIFNELARWADLRRKTEDHVGGILKRNFVQFGLTVEQIPVDFQPLLGKWDLV